VPRADTLHGDWLISSRAKFKVNWDTEGAAPGGNSHCAKEGFIVSSFNTQTADSVPQRAVLFVWRFAVKKKMSIYASEAGYFNSSENNENHGVTKLRVKDEDAKLTVQGSRTVLGTLTNRPLTNVAVKSKQVGRNSKLVLLLFVLELLCVCI